MSVDMRIERIYKIDRLLRQNKFVPVSRFLEELEVSLATFKRDIEYMRCRLHAPIAWDREGEGYTFTAPAPRSPQYRLPGMWLDAAEMDALQQLLSAADRLLGEAPHLLGPLKARLAGIAGAPRAER